MRYIIIDLRGIPFPHSSILHSGERISSHALLTSVQLIISRRTAICYSNEGCLVLQLVTAGVHKKRAVQRSYQPAHRKWLVSDELRHCPSRMEDPSLRSHVIALQHIATQFSVRTHSRKTVKTSLGDDFEMGFLGVYKAIYDYEPRDDGELAISEGDLLYILEKNDDDGWWKAKKKAGPDEDDEPMGLVPNNYVEQVSATTLVALPIPWPVRDRQPLDLRWLRRR